MNVFIFFYLLILSPKLFWERIVRGKRHPKFLQRLGFKLVKPEKPLIWIHAVSVGEIKATQPLYLALRKKYPKTFFLITTTTATGYKEAERSLKTADGFAFFPIDFSWTVRRWIENFKPEQFILVESDFWPNLLKELKRHGTKISLVSGKMSERSFRRFSLFTPLAKKLFSYFDHICVQNEEHQKRFLKFVSDPAKLFITGNLKLDLEPQKVSEILDLPERVITLSCTHFPEEEKLLDVLIDGDWFLILAPRHPERFNEVEELLFKKKIPFSKWSENQIRGKVLLVDAMGKLPICYHHSRLTILGGSFVPHIGGHNVFEPLLYGSSVFFGPHMFGQKELAKYTLESGAAKQLALLELRSEVELFFDQPDQESKMQAAGINLIRKMRGSTKKTLNLL